MTSRVMLFFRRPGPRFRGQGSGSRVLALRVLALRVLGLRVLGLRVLARGFWLQGSGSTGVLALGFWL